MVSTRLLVPGLSRFANGGTKVNNPYLPYPVRIDSIITETEDRNLKTFKLVFINPEA